MKKTCKAQISVHFSQKILKFWWGVKSICSWQLQTVSGSWEFYFSKVWSANNSFLRVSVYRSKSHFLSKINLFFTTDHTVNFITFFDIFVYFSRHPLWLIETRVAIWHYGSPSLIVVERAEVLPEFMETSDDVKNVVN